jgi:hypothetical protein
MRSLRILAPLAIVLAACDDPNFLPPATSSNRVDTVAVYAVTGTPVWQPSAFAMTGGRVVRLDQTNVADFVFDIRSDGQAVFLPGAMVGHPGSAGLDPGLQHRSETFDGLTLADLNGYVTLDTLQLAPGDVFLLRSRIPGSCFFGLPLYGKLEVLAIDPAVRAVRFQIMVNFNCGYRGLEPGIPKQ